MIHSKVYRIKGIEVEPIVRVIDNFDRNESLGLIFEQKVGKGTLMTCGCDLRKHLENPVIRCLYNSIIRYLKLQ